MSDNDVTVSENDVAASDNNTGQVALFSSEDTDEFRSRWAEIQRDFVDRPRDVVADADRLVADLTERISRQFTDERNQLEAQWDRDEDVSTEDLRLALKRYRTFFERLLAA